MKRFLAVLCSALVLTSAFSGKCLASMPPEFTAVETAAAAQAAEGPQLQAPEAILMEASTGTVIYEKNGDEARNPASVTKIMTLLLTFDALKSGKIHLNDEVVTSAHAKSMGGSQVFLEDCEIIGRRFFRAGSLYERHWNLKPYFICAMMLLIT